jgi:hypothetical protein
MEHPNSGNIRMRKVFCVLSSKSLPYAEKGLASLLKNVLEPLDITLITDALEDKQAIVDALSSVANPANHPWQVFDKSDADERAEEQFHPFEYLKAFRHGHPCWRKLTDPFLFSRAGEEVIILDPDLYFPNRFTFEPTPNQQLLLMWQPPNCLFPPESVKAAIAASVPLANHVDIGVAQVKAAVDWEWFNWLVGQLGGTQMPRIAHIEAIIWSAMAMRMGGGHLNPQRWKCWHRSQWKRILLKGGVAGTSILQKEDWSEMKCFHGGGIAKWWIIDAEPMGFLEGNNQLELSSDPIPFVELTPAEYRSEQRMKDLLRKSGYYALMNH